VSPAPHTLVALIPSAARGALLRTGQPLEVRCTAVIVAFGATCQDASFLAPLRLERGLLPHDRKTMRASQDPVVFAGGDLVGSHSIVEAVNDGKTAAWHIHCMLQRSVPGVDPATLPNPAVPHLPALHTIVDDVDVSVEFLGKHFVNPFGLSRSAAFPLACSS